jgi:hypothetical protein
MNTNLTDANLKGRILRIRGQQVMLGQDLAFLYGVQPKVLIQAVKRNLERFPRDFMFQLSNQEFEILKSQIVTSSWGGARRANPYAFTEQGIAMLSSVLRSRNAIQINIAIMRAFVSLRHAMVQSRDLIRRVEKVEGKIGLIETDIRFMLHDIRDIKKPLEIPPKPQPNVKGFEK